MAGKITAESVVQFAHDYAAIKQSGDAEALGLMTKKLQTDFSDRGAEFSQNLLGKIDSYSVAEDPQKQIAALNDISFQLDNPDTYNKPKDDLGFTRTALGAGYRQAMMPFTNRFDPAASKESQDWMDNQANSAGLTTGQFIGGMLPEMLTAAALSRVKPVTAALKWMKLSPSVVNSAAAGAAIGGVDPEQDAMQMAIAGAAGAATGKVVASRFQPSASKQDVNTQALIDKQREKGYWASPGYQSGSKAKEQLDHAIKKNSATADYVDERLKTNRQMLNKEFAQAVGIESPPPNLSVDLLDMRRAQINRELDDFYNRAQPVFTASDRNAGASAARIYERNTGTKPPAEFANFRDRYETLAEAARTSATTGNWARVYAQLRNLNSDMSERAHYHYTNPNGDRVLAQQYRMLLGRLDGAVGRTVPAADLEKWKSNRRQQGLLLDMVAHDKELLATGNVSPRALLGVIESGKTRNLQYIQRDRDLFDSARFVQKQEQSFENSLHAGQKFGHYLRHLEIPTATQTMADILKPVPLANIAVQPYLGGRFYRNAKDAARQEFAGYSSGILGVHLGGEYSKDKVEIKPGLLD